MFGAFIIDVRQNKIGKKPILQHRSPQYNTSKIVYIMDKKRKTT